MLPNLIPLRELQEDFDAISKKHLNFIENLCVKSSNNKCVLFLYKNKFIIKTENNNNDDLSDEAQECIHTMEIIISSIDLVHSL